jgi:hypothetical protein
LKTLRIHILKLSALFALCFSLAGPSFGQGRVVVNEFMAWSGCSTTSEFIELMNFGPGPANIGCYIVTNGNYAVTIPPGTILQPGQYYVISGQNTLAKNCGNIDSAITVDLNWNTCNCADKPVPTTGDGFMQDGGSANEKVIILDPNLKVVDAVSRKSPVSASIPITTNTLTGGCTSKTFDLDTMAINYEYIGQSTGVDNSFARKVDGDCEWVKTPSISADAPNKTNNTSSTNYQFNTLSASECASTAGKVSIGVSAANVASLFPMSYILAYDKDSNNVFNLSDTYTYGVDSSAPSIDINNLAYGRYRITVSSVYGCDLKTFDFFIFNCYGVVLPLKLVSFKYAGVNDGQYQFQCQISGSEYLKSLVLEGSEDGIYHPVSTYTAAVAAGDALLTLKAPLSAYSYYRLKLTDISGVVSYSPLVRLGAPNATDTRQWPNPVKDRFFIQLNAPRSGKRSYTIYNMNGMTAANGSFEVKSGTNTISIPSDRLLAGIYQLQVSSPASGEPPISFRFVKH